MFKIEEHWLQDDGSWRKMRHRLYESEKSFNTYWAYHIKDGFYWYNGKKKLVGFQNGVQVKEHLF